MTLCTSRKLVSSPLPLKHGINLGNSPFPQNTHALSFPNLPGFACNSPVFGAIELIGNAGLPMTCNAAEVVHASPYGDDIVEHLLQVAVDIAWLRQLPLGERILFNF